MKDEHDTRELPVGEAEAAPDLGPWGTDAVPLGNNECGRKPTESPSHTGTRPHRRGALAAIVCVSGLLAALGVNTIGGKPGPQTERPQTTETRPQPSANEPGTNGASAARRIEQRQQQARSKLRQRSTHSTLRARPAPRPTYTIAPEPTPPPEPVTPRPPPAPAAEPTPTTTPPPASGPAVAKEFGFER